MCKNCSLDIFLLSFFSFWTVSLILTDTLYTCILDKCFKHIFFIIPQFFSCIPPYLYLFLYIHLCIRLSSHPSIFCLRSLFSKTCRYNVHRQGPASRSVQSFSLPFIYIDVCLCLSHLSLSLPPPLFLSFSFLPRILVDCWTGQIVYICAHLYLYIHLSLSLSLLICVSYFLPI